MMVQSKIFEKEPYCVYMQLDDENFDYYSLAIIKIIANETEYIIYKDNLLYLKNVINYFKESVEYIDDRLDEKNLGKLLNIYYKFWCNKR